MGELREAQRRMEAIVGSLADAVTIRARSGRLIYANEAALRSMGITSVDDIIERDPDALLRDYITTDEQGNELPSAALPSVRLLRGLAAEPLLLRFVEPASGAEQWRVLKATPLYDADGNVEAAVTIIEDVTAAKRAERQTRFLSRVSEILASSLDYGETLRNVAWLAVPEVADWCGVELIDDRGVRRQVVVAHPDPEKLVLAERLREYEPVDPDPAQGLAAVLATGESQLFADISDELLAAAAVDEEHLRLLRAVGMRSLVMVAMRTGGRTIGAMTLVSAESGRRFTADDVRFAEQVAARGGGRGRELTPVHRALGDRGHVAAEPAAGSAARDRGLGGRLALPAGADRRRSGGRRGLLRRVRDRARVADADRRRDRQGHRSGGDDVARAPRGPLHRRAAARAGGHPRAARRGPAPAIQPLAVQRAVHADRGRSSLLRVGRASATAGRDRRRGARGRTRRTGARGISG